MGTKHNVADDPTRDAPLRPPAGPWPLWATDVANGSYETIDARSRDLVYDPSAPALADLATGHSEAIPTGSPSVEEPGPSHPTDRIADDTVEDFRFVRDTLLSFPPGAFLRRLEYAMPTLIWCPQEHSPYSRVRDDGSEVCWLVDAPGR